MSYLELSKEETDAIRRAEKCFRLAARAGTPEEAATANAMGQEIMLAYNISMAMLEEHGGDKGKRQDEKLRGGQYEFQRNLWKEVAELNFCIYFNIVEQIKVPRWEKRKAPDVGFKRVYDLKRIRTHRLVGRVVNVKSAMVMADYLEQAIERITKEEIAGNGEHLYSKWAMAFREGIVDTVTEKIADRRKHLVDEEKRTARRAEAAARAATDGEISTATAVTIASVKSAEWEANMDIVDPEWRAKKAAQEERDANHAKWRREQQQKEAESKRRANERWTRWAADHPLEAAMQQAEAKKRREQEEKRQARNEARRVGRNYGYTKADQDYDLKRHARRVGRERGHDVSLDQQAGNERRKALR